MAYNEQGEWVDDWTPDTPSNAGWEPQTNAPGGGQASASDVAARQEGFNERSRQDPTFNPRDAEAEANRAIWERELKREGGSLYDPSDLETVIRNAGYLGGSGGDALRHTMGEYAYRRTNTPNDENRDGVRDAPRAGAGGRPVTSYTGQFDDPWTKQLEEEILQQMNAIKNPGPNDSLAMMQNFLRERFGELSTSQGYSNPERALLNTQAFEPIEALRQASQQRSMERTGARGFLPSSGIALRERADIDKASDQSRTAANRDLGINAINERTNRLNQALGLVGQLQSTDENVRNKALQLATLIYQLPQQAQANALAVISGSGQPQSLLSEVNKIAGQNQQAGSNWMNLIGQMANIYSGQR